MIILDTIIFILYVEVHGDGIAVIVRMGTVY